MKEKIRSILTDKKKLIYGVIMFLVIGVIVFIVHKVFSDKFSMIRALKSLDGGYEYHKKYYSLLPIVTILRILLLGIVLILSFLSYKFLDLREKIKKGINITEDKLNENTSISKTINKKYFNIIIIILLIFPLIHCFSEAYNMSDRLLNQIEIVSLTEEIASYNNYIGYSYKSQVNYERFELIKMCIVMIVHCLISIVSTIIIVILFYKTITLIKKEHFVKSNNVNNDNKKI